MPQLVRLERSRIAIPRRTSSTLHRAWRAARGVAVLRTVAGDIRHDSVRAARRAVRQTRYRTEDLLRETAHRVKRRPFRAMGLALTAGSVLGLTAARLGHRR